MESIGFYLSRRNQIAERLIFDEDRVEMY